jgi:hypothetical protein
MSRGSRSNGPSTGGGANAKHCIDGNTGIATAFPPCPTLAGPASSAVPPAAHLAIASGMTTAGWLGPSRPACGTAPGCSSRKVTAMAVPPPSEWPQMTRRLSGWAEWVVVRHGRASRTTEAAPLKTPLHVVGVSESGYCVLDAEGVGITTTCCVVYICV